MKIMKRVIYTILLAAATGVTSCKDFLETTPTDFITPANYFRNENDVNVALAGVYDILGKCYSRTLWWEADVADQFFDNRSYATQDVSLNNFDASETKIASLWQNLYLGIDRANVLLANLDKADMDTGKKEVARGEAKFLRAYYYFLLVNYWGDVPFRTQPTTSVNDVNIARTPSKEIYAFVVKEMEEAEALVNKISAYAHNSRVTKSAVRGILARVYLKMAGYPLNDKTKYADALKWALKVNENGEHSLNPSYAQIFINHSKDLYDKQEGIWEVEFNKVGELTYEEGNLGVVSGIPTTNTDIGYSTGVIQVLEKHFRLYPSAQRDSITPTGTVVKVEYSPDTRRDWNIAPFYYSGTTKVYYSLTQLYNRKNGKWRREYETALPKAQNTSPANFPVLRYADVLLMIAEAENEVNGPTEIAYNAVNAVIRRAYATPSEAVGLKDLSQDQFRAALKEERARELFSEALRKFDLIRWGDYLTEMRALGNSIRTTAPSAYVYAARAADNSSERSLLLPIPLTELTLNNLITQNTGW